jgi:hypothetical protein
VADAPRAVLQPIDTLTTSPKRVLLRVNYHVSQIRRVPLANCVPTVWHMGSHAAPTVADVPIVLNILIPFRI